MASPTLYFFNGAAFIRWTVGTTSERKDAGYPMNTADRWRGADDFMNDIDAALNGEDGKVYFFRGDEYIAWTIAEGQDGRDAGPPRKISTLFPHPFFANGVDAAANRGGGVVYFFKGREYVRWNLTRGLEEGPLPIADRWDRFMANGVDAALGWGTDSLYFFRGNEYLRWDLTAPPGENVARDYPRQIAGHWDSFLDNGIKAALNWDPVPNFIFLDDVSAADAALLRYVHALVLARIGRCIYLSEAEKADLLRAYKLPIRNGAEHDWENNGTALGQTIRVNFTKLRRNKTEMARTVIHEMMHVAGHHHPRFGEPGYYETSPLRAEECIVGPQADVADGAAAARCVAANGACAIRTGP